MDERYARLNERDPLVKLNQIIDWGAFREPLVRAVNPLCKSQAGRKPCDVVLMFKVLVLQHLYNVSEAPAGAVSYAAESMLEEQRRCLSLRNERF